MPLQVSGTPLSEFFTVMTAQTIQTPLDAPYPAGTVRLVGDKRLSLHPQPDKRNTMNELLLGLAAPLKMEGWQVLSEDGLQQV